MARPTFLRWTFRFLIRDAGINDDGSGSATNLQLAIDLYKSGITPVNQVTAEANQSRATCKFCTVCVVSR